MPTRLRGVFPGYPHHAIVRGYRRRPVFGDAPDRHLFLALLEETTDDEAAPVWAWALMSNHAHLILVPSDPETLTRAIEACLETYTQNFREKYSDETQLWNRRVYLSPLDRQEFLWRAVRYVELNPVRAGLVHRAEDYAWSSAAYHCGHTPTDPLVSPDSPLPLAIDNWSDWLASTERRPRSSDPESKFVSRVEYLRRGKRLK
jgi:putative transposase